MNVYKLSSAGINVAEGIKRFGGNEGLYEKYLKKFSADENFSLLCQCIEAGDAAAAFQAGHALKGLSGNMSMTRLYEGLLPLVEELREGSLARAQALLEPVRREYNAVTAALAEE